MADGTIINQNDRTGVLDIEGEIARAAANVTEIDANSQDMDDDAPSGKEALSQSIESFTRPGGGNSPSTMGQMGLAMPAAKSIGPFQILTPRTTPFTLMSPTTNLSRQFKGPNALTPGGPKAGNKGRKKDKDHGKVGVVSAYGGGLQEISGAKMPSAMQLKTMMLDPELLESLQNEKRKMDDPEVHQGAERLNAQDWQRLKESPDHLEKAEHRNAYVQRLTKGPGMG